MDRSTRPTTGDISHDHRPLTLLYETESGARANFARLWITTLCGTSGGRSLPATALCLISDSGKPIREGMSSPFFDSKHVMIHWDAGSQAITMQWKRPAQHQVFREGLDAALSQAEASDAHRFVADHSIVNLQDEDESFFLRQWVPKLARAGIRRLAIVVHRRVYVQIPKTRLQQRLKSGALTLHYFAAMDEARIWVQAAEAA